jgi:hypothetical protein
LDSFSQIISNLERFKSKFYKNQLLRGALIALAAVLLIFITVVVLEYLGRFHSGVRTFLFYSSILVSSLLLVKYLAIPLYKLSNLGKSMTDDEASSIIGKHFPEVSDKLLNAIQLKRQSPDALKEGDLLLASINQKIAEIKPVNFNSAVNFSENRKYLKYLAIPLVLIGVIVLFQSNILVEGTERILYHKKEFKNQAPFEFILKNKKLEVVKNQEFTIELDIEGNTLPSEVYVNVDGNPVKMKKLSASEYSYNLGNVTRQHEFQFTSGEYYSDNYNLKMLPNPLITGFSAELNFPSYTGLKSKKINNVGDLNIPEGTTVTWKFNTKDVKGLNFTSNGKRLKEFGKSKNSFQYQRRFTRSEVYKVKLFNEHIESPDSVQYSVSVLADKFPSITVEKKVDSTQNLSQYFFGTTSDDYGVKKITFNYKILGSKREGVKIGEVITKVIETPNVTDKSFYYLLETKELGIELSDEVEYYFEVWDNDAINGSKKSRSKVYTYKAPSEEELKKKRESHSKNVKKELSDAMKEAANLQKKMEEINKDLSNKKSLDWQDKKKIQDLISEQQKMEDKLLRLQEEIDKNQKEQNEFKKNKEDILKKQEQLKKLMNEVMSEEMKELYKKLQELLKKNNKEQIKKHLDKMKMNEREMEKQLDRTLEQFKQMEVEQKLEDAMEKLEELIKQQEELADKTEGKKESNEELKKEQEELEKKFDEVSKDLKDAKEKNKDLESPMKIDAQEEKQEEVKKDMEGSKEDLSKGKNKKSGQKQRGAQKKMEEMKENLEQMMQENEDEQNEEDYQALREILENLVQLSFDQESLLREFKVLRDYNPKYIQLAQTQKKLKDDAKIIEDSLFALSKRNVTIQNFINKEVGEMNQNMDKAMTMLQKRYTHYAVRNQQYAMTSMNNLAVMLSEALEQMQQQMKQSREQKACKNPGKGNPKSKGKGNKPKLGDMKSQQRKMSKMLGEMKKKMDKGGKPSSEELAKMAAQQEAMRRALQQLQEELNGEGKPNKLGNLNKTQELMEEQEKDLVNKRITPETLRRNQEILTRLLEHDKAEKEQDTEDKREANQGEDATRETPPELEEYLEKIKREQELLKSVPHGMSPYYKRKVREYFRGIGS